MMPPVLARMSLAASRLSLVANAPLDCPGSWRPVPDLQPGDEVYCDFCGKKVAVTLPPLDVPHDPWSGSRDPRIQAHWFPKRAASQ